MFVSRREFLAASAGALTLASFGRASAFGQAAGSTPGTSFTDVRRNVGIFTGRGGTIGWLVNKDAVVVVDTQFPDTAAICLDGIKKKGAGRSIDLLFNTHHHPDHTMGNGVFKPASRRIVAHKNVPGLQRKAAADSPDKGEPLVVADATFENTWSDQVGDERVTAAYYGPGHTSGDAAVQFERAHVVHMGDLLFHDMHPFVDRQAGASVQNWMTAVETIAREMPVDTIFIAGHARPGAAVTVDRKVVLKQRDYFDAVLTLARKGIAQGRSRDAVMAASTLPGFDHYHSNPPALTLGNVLGVAYDELTSKG
jgi:cyclase